MIRIDRETFLEVSNLMSVGKNVQGLIHNLNGPLQNLGMDMDMIGFSLQGRQKPLPALMEEIAKRLGRMEDEFDQINRLIRAAASRATTDEEERFLFLGDFLEQEVTFLSANLYFKHKVDSKVMLEDGLPQLGTLAQGVPSGLRSLLSAVIEDIERREMQEFSLEARKRDSGIQVLLTAGKGSLSGIFHEDRQMLSPGNGPLEVGRDQMAAVQAFMALEQAGVGYKANADQGRTLITLTLSSP